MENHDGDDILKRLEAYDKTFHCKPFLGGGGVGGMEYWNVPADRLPMVCQAFFNCWLALPTVQVQGMADHYGETIWLPTYASAIVVTGTDEPGWVIVEVNDPISPYRGRKVSVFPKDGVWHQVRMIAPEQGI